MIHQPSFYIQRHILAAASTPHGATATELLAAAPQYPRAEVGRLILALVRNGSLICRSGRYRAAEMWVARREVGS